MRNDRREWLLAAGSLAAIVVLALLLWGGGTSEAGHEHDDGKAGSVWGAGYFPNIPLTTHDGREVRFFDDLIEGKVVAINFIYTSCPDACPMETARMREVQDILGDRMGKDVFFYSITIDPEYDTQPVLAEFVDQWQIGPGWWFLTGKDEDITHLRKKLGVYDATILEDNPNNHNLNLVIGNQATGRWMKRSPYENPYVLANQLGSWLHNWKLASTEKREYADAPELRKISTGENLYRTRCASCHTIGEGDIEELDERRIGPDLYQVTAQRDRAWLTRWLIEPDVMLEEKDPLATALFEQYREVPMPNLRLTEIDAEKILGYIEEESRRIERHVKMGHRADPRAAKTAQADPGGHGDHGDHGGHDAHDNHGDHAAHDAAGDPHADRREHR